LISTSSGQAYDFSLPSLSLIFSSLAAGKGVSSLSRLTHGPEGPFETVAGYLMAVLGHLPQVGENVEVDGHRLTVTEVDGRRVSRVRLTPPPAAPADADES